MVNKLAKSIKITKPTSFGVTLDPDTANAFEAYRWENWMKRPELVHAALTEYAANHGIELPVVAESAE